MVADGEEDALSTHALETSGELNLGNGEGVAKVERTVHVSVRESAEPLGVLGLDLLHRDALLEKVGVGGHALGKRGGVGLEDMVSRPVRLGALLEVNEVVALASLQRQPESLLEWVSVWHGRTFSMVTTGCATGASVLDAMSVSECALFWDSFEVAFALGGERWMYLGAMGAAAV